MIYPNEHYMIQSFSALGDLINLKGKMCKRRFDNSKTQKLMERMSENEKGEFGFDVGSIDWRDYITNVHIPGLRRHVMKGRGMCG